LGEGIEVRAMRAGDAEAVLGIYGEGIATGHATFETEVPGWAEWEARYRPEGRLIAEHEGEVAGFAALAPVSSRCVYQGVAEVSLYVAAAHQGRGVGRRLLEALVEAAEAAGIWSLEAGIFPENRTSRRLFEGAGFRLVGRHERLGRMRHGPMAGYWRDVLLLERRSLAVGDGGAGAAAPPPLPGVRALLFDVFGTVVDWRGSIARELEAFFAARGRTVDGDALARAWRARYQPAMAAVRAGRRGFVKLDVLHRENLVDVLAAFAIEGLDDAAIDHLTRAWHRLEPWPDSVEGLTRLKHRFTIAPCSNGHMALITAMAKHAGLPWDAVLGAEIARAYKPDPEAYLASAAALDLRPEQCCMVAAHNDDLAAARAQGLHTAFVPRPEEYGPDQHPDQLKDLAATAAWDTTATDLVDLARKLGC